MKWEIGQLVESLVDAQGMTKGARYRVVDLETRSTLAGKFSTYYLAGEHDRSGGASLAIHNAHLVLKGA